MFWGRSKKILSWTCEKKKIRKTFSYQDIGGNYYQPMLHYIYEKEAEGPFHTRRDVQMPHKAEISSNKYSNMWVGKYTMAIYGFKKCIHCLSKKLDVVFGIRHIQKSEPVKTTAPLTTKSSIVNCLFNEKPDLVYHVKLYSTKIYKLICTVTIKRHDKCKFWPFPAGATTTPAPWTWTSTTSWPAPTRSRSGSSTGQLVGCQEIIGKMAISDETEMLILL